MEGLHIKTTYDGNAVLFVVVDENGVEYGRYASEAEATEHLPLTKPVQTS